MILHIDNYKDTTNIKICKTLTAKIQDLPSFHPLELYAINEGAFEVAVKLVAGSGWGELAEDAADVVFQVEVLGIVNPVAMNGEVEATEAVEDNGVAVL